MHTLALTVAIDLHFVLHGLQAIPFFAFSFLMVKLTPKDCDVLIF